MKRLYEYVSDGPSYIFHLNVIQKIIWTHDWDCRYNKDFDKEKQLKI